jgi:hypothetical protein
MDEKTKEVIHKKMNTKIGAILLVSLVALSVAIPMVLGADPITSATVNDATPSYECTATLTTAPGAGTNGLVSFSLTVTDLNGPEDISDSGWSAEWPGGGDEVPLAKTSETATSETFTGTDPVPYTTEPGVKTVSFEEGETQRCTNTFTVAELTAYGIDFTAVDFGLVTINVKATVSGDTTMGSGGPTIENLGNKVMDVTISATDMTGATDNIDNANLGAKVGTTAEQDLDETREFEANIPIAGTALIDYYLTAQPGTKDESKSGTTTVTGVVSTE